MYKNIVGFYIKNNMSKRAMAIKWIEVAIEQEGDFFDAALAKVIQPV